MDGGQDGLLDAWGNDREYCTCVWGCLGGDRAGAWVMSVISVSVDGSFSGVECGTIRMLFC